MSLKCLEELESCDCQVASVLMGSGTLVNTFAVAKRLSAMVSAVTVGNAAGTPTTLSSSISSSTGGS